MRPIDADSLKQKILDYIDEQPTIDAQGAKRFGFDVDKLLDFTSTERAEALEIYRSCRKKSERELARNTLFVLDKFYFKIRELRGEK